MLNSIDDDPDVTAWWQTLQLLLKLANVVVRIGCAAHQTLFLIDASYLLLEWASTVDS